MDRFRAKVRQFLMVNQNDIAILKLRRNEPLTATDLSELERIFTEAGVGTPEEMERIREEGGLGIFIRSLVGLDRAAAMHAFDAFIEGRKLTSHQHEFVDMVIDHLTARGVMDPRLFYESPFTDLDPLGVAGVFGEGEVVTSLQRRVACELDTPGPAIDVRSRLKLDSRPRGRHLDVFER